MGKRFDQTHTEGPETYEKNAQNLTFLFVKALQNYVILPLPHLYNIEGNTYL